MLGAGSFHEPIVRRRRTGYNPERFTGSSRRTPPVVPSEATDLLLATRNRRIVGPSRKFARTLEFPGGIWRRPGDDLKCPGGISKRPGPRPKCPGNESKCPGDGPRRRLFTLQRRRNALQRRRNGLRRDRPALHPDPSTCERPRGAGKRRSLASHPLTSPRRTAGSPDTRVATAWRLSRVAFDLCRTGSHTRRAGSDSSEMPRIT